MSWLKSHVKVMNVIVLVSISLLLTNPASCLTTCSSLIFCQGELLRVVQMAGIFKDSKTFVDMSLINTVDKTLKNFDLMMARTQGSPTRNEVIEFVQKNFIASYNELEAWHPPDFKITPPFLRKIKDLKIRGIAKRMVDLWPNLGRKIRPEVIQNPFKYSIIPVPQPFIVPGGRFREIYYWDSYWIIKGLLICDMKLTARGMIENMFHMVHSFGFIPNGGRIYYLDRSQPPLLAFMMQEYVKATNDLFWLKENIHYLDTELKFWLNYKTIQIERRGKKYLLARFRSNEDTPRPESYIEDIHTAARYRTSSERKQCYMNLRTGAETGWDFSGRWFVDGQGGNRADLSSLKPTRIIPVDLNAILCKAFKIMYDFHKKLRHKQRAQVWYDKYEEWNTALREVLYNHEDGIWYDYDLELGVQRKHFYPSNFAPLWTGTYNKSEKMEYGKNATKYLKSQRILDFQGGIPASLYETGEQWDLPNAWPPSQTMVIFGLDKTGAPEAQEAASMLANKWIESLMTVANTTQEMFEKYSAVYKGMYGGGGEYEVQTGFGWTNGGLLELIEHFYIKKTSRDGET